MDYERLYNVLLTEIVLLMEKHLVKTVEMMDEEEKEHPVVKYNSSNKIEL